jgi:hypothetical protein
MLGSHTNLCRKGETIRKRKEPDRLDGRIHWEAPKKSWKGRRHLTEWEYNEARSAVEGVIETR